MLKYGMEKNTALFSQLLLTAIIGVVSIGVSFIGDLSRNIQVMSISVQELNVKMGQIASAIADHEARIRTIEQSKH